MAERVQTVTLAAGVAQTVALTRDWNMVEVLNVNGAGAVFFRNDGGTATVAGDECWCVPAVTGAAVQIQDTASTTSVSLISAAATQVTVAGVR